MNKLIARVLAFAFISGAACPALARQRLTTNVSLLLRPEKSTYAKGEAIRIAAQFTNLGRNKVLVLDEPCLFEVSSVTRIDKGGARYHLAPSHIAAGYTVRGTGPGWRLLAPGQKAEGGFELDQSTHPSSCNGFSLNAAGRYILQGHSSIWEGDLSTPLWREIPASFAVVISSGRPP
jgi:hypothetical protein